MDKENQYTLFPYGKVILLISLVLTLEWYLYLSAIKFKAILPGFTTMLKSELNMIIVVVITLIASIFFRKYKDNFLSLTYTALLIILTTFFARFLPLTQHKMIDYSLSKFDRFFGINSAKIFQYMFFHHNTMTHIIGYGYSALVTLAAIGIILLANFRPVNLKRLVSAYGISFILLIPFYYFFPSYGPIILPENAHLAFLESIRSNEYFYYMARTKHIVGSTDVVAFPSYHVLIMLLIYFFIRDVKLFLINHLYLIYTIFLMFAVVILAEHFFADIVGALIFFTISVGLLKLLEGRYKVKALSH